MTLRRAPLLLFLLGAVACGPPPAPPRVAAATQPATAPASRPAAAVTLGVDDVFEVRVYGEADLSNVYRVTPDGNIGFPLIGKVRVGGRTPAEVAREIEVRLGQRYLQNPQVTIFVREYKSRRFSVYGQVQRPGTFPFEQGVTIIEAIAMAGGFTPMAAENDVRISRTLRGRDQTLTVRVVDIREGRAPAVPILPGDKIFVPERFF
jgi:protein involved in polysaccharide export with SLBB domain